MSTIVTRPEAAPASRRGGFWRTPALLGSLCVLLTVMLANAIFLTGLRSNDPKMYYSGLGSPGPGTLKGGWTIDWNVGWTVEALGRAAARQWAHGHVPLWNSYEGLGQPLAGEMQSAALFQPFIMLQLLPHGVFIMHLVLQLVAGLTTMFFLRRLRLGWVAATAGGCLFAVNGAFAVMTNAPFNPIAFLPMGLLGVEMISASLFGRMNRDDRSAAQQATSGRMNREDRSAAQRASDRSDSPSPDRENVGRFRPTNPRPWGGFAVLALAIGWMLLAGFPETAFLEGLFIGCWALMRLVQARGHRGQFAAWTFGGLALGLALASPVLVAFADFMSWGSTSYHEAVANDVSYAPRQLTSLALPFAVGGHYNAVIQLQAGYLTLPAVLLALVGLTGRGRRGMRLLLVATMVVLIGNMFRFEPVKIVLNHTPGIKAILVYKYGISILEFAVVVAAAMGLDDLARRRVSRARAMACATAVAAYAAGSVAYLERRGYVTNPRWSLLVLGSLFAVCAALTVLLLRAHPRRDERGADAARGTSTVTPPARRTASAVLAGALLALTAAAHFAVPQAGASKASAIDTAPVTYLQQHQGLSRFYTLGPIQPDYGSYWGLAQLNVNDLPVPKKYGEFVLDDLRPRTSGLTQKQLGSLFQDYQLIAFNSPAAVQRKLLAGYGEKQQAFRDAGVRYLVTRPDVVSPQTATKLGLVKVLDSPRTDVFEDAKAAPYYTAPGCTTTNATRTDVTLTCPNATTLTRRELNAPGWSASINGVTHDVSVSDDARFQAISVPKGTSHLTFEYRPKHFALAATLCLAALAVTLASLVAALAGTLRGRRRTSPTPPRHQTDAPRRTGATPADPEHA